MAVSIRKRPAVKTRSVSRVVEEAYTYTYILYTYRIKYKTNHKSNHKINKTVVQ